MIQTADPSVSHADPTAPESPPILMAVVDTEEEFDWRVPLRRDATAVTAMASVARGQEIFHAFGLRPVYAVDYPVASQEAGAAPLRPFVAAGQALIGAHLHPWNTPPFDEEINARNSYPGNLPASLERAKLANLTDAIEQAFQLRPTLYKAGRYGLGPNTPGILEELGYRIDLSPSPPFDFRADGGPDFSGQDANPSWNGPRGNILTLPTTGGYSGVLASRHAHVRYRASQTPWARRVRLPGILARSGLLNRARLSPEGASLRELKTLTRALLRQGVRVFTLSYHSPSLLPGCTSYVRDARELTTFLDCIRGYLTFFSRELQGRFLTPPELRQQLLRSGG
ncbi:MAG: polysaccharide deacetylase family protein [Magnetococcales bacterium]|nr:polysaccharide deacetylase family protein [Magnetococcales bacterium]